MWIALPGLFPRTYPSIDAEIGVDEWFGLIASIFISGSVGGLGPLGLLNLGAKSLSVTTGI